MKYNYLSFPHPVLGIKDDINGDYSVDFVWKPEIEFQTLAFKHKLTNPIIENLINTKKAGYFVEIHCPASLYRESFMDFKKEFVLKIPTSRVINKVIVQCFIIAVEKINNYQNNAANVDYLGYKFNIEKGDILGVNKSRFEFFAEKNYESYMKISSFIEIVPGDLNEGPITFKTTQDKIYIEMPKKDYRKYSFFKDNPSLYPLFHSSLALPALIFALNKMRDSEDDKNTAWYQKLDERISQDKELETFDIKTLSNLPQIAQIILKNPVERTLLGLEKIMNKGEE